MSLSVFLGSELVTALGQLDARRVLGPWPGHRPRDRRPAMRFVPVLYGEDHAHSHSELCLLLAGRCRFSYGRRGSVLAAGDLVVCPAGQAHAEAYVRRGGPYRLAWWNLHPSEPTLHITRYSARGGFAVDHRLDLRALPAEARSRLDTLRELAAAGAPPDADRLREALLTVTLALYRRVLAGGEKRMDTRSQLVRDAAEFVRAHAGRPLALAEVARAVHVSPNYLTGLFRAHAGLPLGRFILEERMARARRLLPAAGATVKSVALELGFADPFAFSRAFKRVTGTAPARLLGRR